MILDFGKYKRNPFYFDCFMSTYDVEQEYLFLGGYAALEIRNILQFIPNTNKIENYSVHLASIECLLSVLQNESIESETLSVVNSKNKTLSSLIKNKRDGIHEDAAIPDYISRLFNHRCSKINQLNIDLKEFIDT